MFQAFNLVPTLTALENITLPLDIARRPVDRAHLDAVVQAVGEVQDHLRNVRRRDERGVGADEGFRGPDLPAVIHPLARPCGRLPSIPRP